MSWEGYGQGLCEKGHSNTIGQYDDEPECNICSSKIVWTHWVDQTNGCYCDDDDKIRGENCPAHSLPLEVDKPVKLKECPTCHHKEVEEPQTYKIPETK